jgi:hypothetical protein
VRRRDLRIVQLGREGVVLREGGKGHFRPEFRAGAADAYLIPRIADARRTSEARDYAAITQHAACDHLRGARGVSRDR